MIAALLCVFVATILDRSSVIVLRNLTNSIITPDIAIQTLWFWAIAYPVLLLSSQLVWRLSGFTGMRWFMNYRATAYKALYEYLTLHSKDYFNNRFAGALTNKIGHAVDGTENLFEKSLWQFIPLALGLILYIYFSWDADYRLGLIITIWSIFFLSLNIWFSKKMQPLSMRSAETLSVLKGKLVDSLTNISLVHEYAHVQGERDYIKKYIEKHKRAGFKHWTVSEWILLTNNILLFVFISAMIGTAIFLFQTQAISLGVIVMVISIVTSVTNQFLFIGQEMRNADNYYGEAKEGLLEILEKHTIVDSASAKSIDKLNGSIDIKAISFNYDDKNIFDNFSLKIPSGQKVGLVGRSGAGKTTLVSLLLRHFDIQEGQIAVGGHDIKELTLESLRRNIAFVPQDTSMFHRTIKDNISYSNALAIEDEIKSAASLSQASEFIEKLPKGYDTLVGERGLKLSGGQRQRVAIARAFLKNAPIVILDEATSSLDSQSEHAIQQSIEELMKKRTVIAIAHRLSTLRKMDRIVVIDNGNIAEDGNPDDLLKKKDGIFKKLWDHQVNGFIIDD